MLGRLGGAASQAGQALSGGLSSAFNALPSEVKGAVVVAGAAIAAILAAAVGAAINGLLLTAIGGAGLAAGIMLAAKDPAVRGAFSSLGTTIMGDLQSAAREFVDPLVDAAEIFRRAWSGSLSGDIRSMFAQLATTVRPLAAGLAGLAKETMPGLKNAVAAAVPVLKDLASMLPMIGRGLSTFFNSLTNSAGAMKGLRLLVILTMASLIGLGYAIEYTTAAFNVFTNNFGRFLNIAAKVPFLFGPLGPLISAAAKEMAEFNDTSNKAQPGLEGVAGSADHAAGSVGKVGASARAAADSMKALSDRIGEMIGNQISVDQALIGWHQALNGVTEAFKENGRTLDLNTSKGQANRQAVLQTIQAAEQQREANIRNGMSVSDANAKYQAQIGVLRNLLGQLGLTQGQIDGLIGSYGRIPRDVWTTVHVRTEFQGFASPGEAMAARLGRRASGGPVKAGTPYIVGERGQEVFTPAVDGYVHNASDTARMLSSRTPATQSGWKAGAGGNMYAITVNVAPGGNLAEAGRQTVEAIRSYERTSGSGWRR